MRPGEHMLDLPGSKCRARTHGQPGNLGESLARQLVMKAATQLGGVVVNSDGEPIGNATVTIAPNDQERFRIMTRADGSFQATYPPGGAVLSARTEHAASLETRVASAEGAGEIRLVVEQTGSIAGLVHSVSGEPMTEIVVYARPVGAAARLPQWLGKEYPHARTDYDGNFVIHGLPRGEYQSEPLTNRPPALCI